VREDVLLQTIREDFEGIFADLDVVVEAAVARAQELAGNQREALGEVKTQLADLDKKIGSLMVVMADPDCDAFAKKAILRETGQLERQRELLHGATSRLAEQAGENTEKLAAAVRQALDEARRGLASIVSPAEFNRFVDRFVGPIVVGSDGSFAQKEPGQVLVSHPTGDIVCTQRFSAGRNPKRHHRPA
jgi:hypothetical protein